MKFILFALPFIISSCIHGSKLETFSVEGRALNSDGAPLAGKKIKLIRPDGFGLSELEKNTASYLSPKDEKIVTTGVDGSFAGDFSYVVHTSGIFNKPVRPMLGVSSGLNCEFVHFVDFTSGKLEQTAFKKGNRATNEVPRDVFIDGELKETDGIRVQLTLKKLSTLPGCI